MLTLRKISHKLLLIAVLATASVALCIVLAQRQLDAWNQAVDNLLVDNQQASLDGEFSADLHRTLGESASYVLTGEPRFREEAQASMARAERTLQTLNNLAAKRGQNLTAAPEDRHQLLLGHQVALFVRVKEQIASVLRNTAEGRPGDPALIDVIYESEPEADRLMAEALEQHELERDFNSERVRAHEARAVLWMSVAVGALALWIALLLAFVGRAVVRPVNALSRVAAGVGEGDFSHTVRVTSRDEIGILQETFNQMIEELWVQRTILAERSSQLARTVESLSRARENAEVASRTKSQFLANMSHEIRTPMNGVLGTTELLAATPLSDEQRHYVEMCQGSAKHLLRIIDDILDFSKIEAGKLALEHIPCALRALVGEVVELVQPRADAKGLAVRTDVAAGVPERVQADPVRLRQVLVNLVENAVKFTAAGSVQVRVELEAPPADAQRLPADAVWLRFSVADTGIGLSAGEQAQVFEAFSQADGSTTRRYGGTGLGLAIARQLVTMMDGRIGVTSEPGRGSTFWFGLPLVPVPGAPAAAPSAPRAPAQLAGHVLVAEDNIINREVARAFLAALGLQVSVAENGREAVERAGRERYDLILMDCQMPELDGFAATARIRALGGEVGRTPIIALTANALEGDRQRCLAAGMDDYLAKPLSRESLQAALERWLGAARRPADEPLRGETG